MSDPFADTYLDLRVSSEVCSWRAAHEPGRQRPFILLWLLLAARGMKKAQLPYLLYYSVSLACCVEWIKL